jgi:hypothetical protein
VVNKTKTPDFGYKASHTLKITPELAESMMLNTLKFSVYGMIEARADGIAPKKKVVEQKDDDYLEEEEAEGGLQKQTTSISTKDKMSGSEDKIKALEKQNAEL